MKILFNKREIFVNMIGVFAIHIDPTLIKMTLITVVRKGTRAMLNLFYMREIYNCSITKLLIQAITHPPN